MKLCAACHQDLPKDRFSKKQWKLGAECQRRCTSCVRDNREVLLSPPVIHNESANNNGIVTSLKSMGINDNEMIPPSDEDLFKMPPPREDCPICFLRMPSLYTGQKYMICCGQFICSGCVHANGRLTDDVKCAFCRTPTHNSQKEAIKRLRKRVEINDPSAIYNLGCCYDDGGIGLPQDYSKAIELWHRAGELGFAQAYNNIGGFYALGTGVERDDEKARHYLELAAINGDDTARFNLGILEKREGNMDRALKHFMIAVECGHVDSLEQIKQRYTDGHATKDDYAQALRSHQTYLVEIRSDQRDKAAAYDDQYKYY